MRRIFLIYLILFLFISPVNVYANRLNLVEDIKTHLVLRLCPIRL